MKFLLYVALSVMIFLIVPEKGTEAAGRAMGIQGGYAWMERDYDRFDNTVTAGVYARVAPILGNVYFQPGLDWIRLKDSSGTWADTWGLHIDAYWYFTGLTKRFQPFLGAGPSMNWFIFKNKNFKDSDAGIDAFLGTVIQFSGRWGIKAEARYCMQDQYNGTQNFIKVLLGTHYSF